MKSPKPRLGVCTLTYRAGSEPAGANECGTFGGTCTHEPAVARSSSPPAVNASSPAIT